MRGVAGDQLESAELVARKRRPPEGVVLLPGEQVPKDDAELACRGDERDLGPAPGPQTLVEGAQGTGTANDDPGRLAEHVARGRRALLGDVAVTRRGLAGLANAGVEPDVGDELSRRLEALDVADRGSEGRRRDEVHPRHAHQPADLRGFERRSRQHPLCLCDFAIEEVDLAQAAGDRLALIGWQGERLEPLPTAHPEDIRHRRAVLEVAGEHRVELVLGPGALADEGAAAMKPAPERPGLLVSMKKGLVASRGW